MILVGVSGGIAAYKSCELVRLLVRAGHDVQVVITPGGERFVGATTFAALSRRPVLTERSARGVPPPAGQPRGRACSASLRPAPTRWRSWPAARRRTC